MPQTGYTGYQPPGQFIGSLFDNSGTITAGGVAQTVIAANASRRYLFVQNQSTAVLYLDVGQVATSASIALAACAVAGDGTGGSMVFEQGFIPTGAVSILGANTGQAYTAKEG